VFGPFQAFSCGAARETAREKIKKARLLAVLFSIFFVRRFSRCAPTTQRTERLEEAKNV